MHSLYDTSCDFSLINTHKDLWFMSHAMALPLISDLIKISPALIILTRLLSFKTVVQIVVKLYSNIFTPLGMYISIVIKIKMVLQLFLRIPNIKSHLNLFSGFWGEIYRHNFPCVRSVYACHTLDTPRMNANSVYSVIWSPTARFLRGCWGDNLKQEK
jgi:hypothetical protein